MTTGRRSTASDSDTRVIILAGGKGTRLHPYTAVLPKPLMPVGDAPILEIILRQLREYGFQRITFAVGHLAGLIEAYFGDGSKWGVELEYFVEATPLGTAGPLAGIKGDESTYLVMNGDVLTTLPYGDVVAWHKEQGSLATIATCRRDVGVQLGVLEIDADERVTAYREKPILTYMASMGVYVLGREARERIAEGVRLDMPDLLKGMIRDDQRVAAYTFDGYWRDIGNHDDYELVCREYDDMKPSLLPG